MVFSLSIISSRLRWPSLTLQGGRIISDLVDLECGLGHGAVFLQLLLEHDVVIRFLLDNVH